MISINEAKQLREKLGFTHLVILGITDDGEQHVVTHGKTVIQAKEAAKMGNQLKKQLGWPSKLCNSKPLDRKCGNCSFWQRDPHRPGDTVEEGTHGKCMSNSIPVIRYEPDMACRYFEPLG